MWTVGFLQHLVVPPWYLHQTTAAALRSGNKKEERTRTSMGVRRLSIKEMAI